MKSLEVPCSVHLTVCRFMRESLHIIAAVVIAAFLPCNVYGEELWRNVDPRIGSEGLGRVFIGPSCPFGMVKPSPDCTVSPNSGWLPMPTQVNGFAQVHVSGTGGGPKYGNILLMPFVGQLNSLNHIAHRKFEEISLGYYATEFEENGIKTEITTAPRASFYRLSYPQPQERALMVDAGFFLGENPVPDAREAQQFVGSETAIVSDREIAGYTRIRGGWNNGRAYTVYFHLISDTPFDRTSTWKGDSITIDGQQFDSGKKTGALVSFADGDTPINLTVGLSFLSERKAKENALNESEGRDFDTVLADCRNEWEKLLSRISVDPETPDNYKRMFYTGLYHTMLMPVDRTGENPLWTDPVPYYDDFYAIWDTYRTSTPLITLIAPERQRDMVRSLINIGKRDGYMPDARSGNANGRTQGGSNAEIVIADAFVKGLEGINYEEALKAMLKDATVSPGGNHEAEGRGGLEEYVSLGFIPHGIPRAGNRTVEYSYCDYAIYLVAKGLGKENLARKYLQQSGNWKNLWRKDYEHDGVKGFIMPRNAEGEWLDSITYGHSEQMKPTFVYTPVTFEGPWYTPWWDMFFYEASSWEYSLSVPHDVEGLIELCGGPEAFENRLDKFFAKEYFNVNNEPSFLTPCLYHWIGKPDKTGKLVHEIIAANYSDTPSGLPGNDDSGAMSSWLAFHMSGLYPNAGQDYYLIHTPLLKSTTFHLANGKDFTVRCEGTPGADTVIESITLNGQPYTSFRLSHKDLMAGGELVLQLRDDCDDSLQDCAVFLPLDKSVSDFNESVSHKEGAGAVRNGNRKTDKSDGVKGKELTKVRFVYKLHGQTRRYDVTYRIARGGVNAEWGIERNGKWQSGSYHISRKALENGDLISFRQPVDGEVVELNDNETWGLLPISLLNAVKGGKEIEFNRTRWRRVDEGKCDPQIKTGERNKEKSEYNLIHLVDLAEGAEMTVLDRPDLPLIMEMKNNPLEINWQIEL